MKILKPMEPVLKEEVPPSGDHFFQVKWDGIRLLAYINWSKNSDVQLFTKNGGKRQTNYPELLDLKEITNGNSCILDGEVCVLDQRGQANFFRILKRDRIREPSGEVIKKYPVKLILFDVLFWKGKWQLEIPLWKRYRLLKKAVYPHKHTKIIENYLDGEKLLGKTQDLDLEGIVAKEKGGYYYPGRKHSGWIKIKNFKIKKAQIVGLILEKNRPKSLVLADNQLNYLGRVSVGVTQREMETIYREWKQVESEGYAKIKTREILNPGERILWGPIGLGAKIRYIQVTPKGTLRSPVVLSFYKA